MIKIEFDLTDPEDDITLHLGAEIAKFDLYFYCLDTTFFADDDSTSKGILNFISMLTNWKIKLNKMIVGKVDFLPFDYYDEYIGFLHVQQIDEHSLKIQLASTNHYAGAGNNPSQLYLINILSKPFHLKGKEYTATKREILDDIDNAINKFLEKLYLDGSAEPEWLKN